MQGVFHDALGRALSATPASPHVRHHGATGEQPNLLLIDTKPLTRSCLVCSMRETLPGMIVGISDIGEARALADGGAHFNIVILNLGEETFDTAKLELIVAPIRVLFPDCTVMLLTSRTDQESMAAAFWNGVQAYLTTDRNLGMTLEAIRFACTGWAIYPCEGWVTAVASGRPRVQNAVNLRSDSSKLTPRQADVLRCLAIGLPNRDIAIELGISQSTVKAHIKGLMLRMGAANRTQVVALLR